MSGYTITEAFLSPCRNRPGDKRTPQGIVIHRTGVNQPDPNIIRRNMQNDNPYPASSHYVIGSNQILYIIPDDERAHHTVGGNNCIGIETCEPITAGSLARLVWLCAYLCDKWRFPKTEQSIKPHSYYDSNTRPHDPFSWSLYKAGKADPNGVIDPFAFYRAINQSTSGGGTAVVPPPSSTPVGISTDAVSGIQPFNTDFIKWDAIDLFGLDTDIVPGWRNRATPFHLRIGDSVFFVPPTSIKVKTVGNVSTMKSMRSKSSIKTKSGYTQTEIRLTLYFGDIEQINGFPVAGPAGEIYSMDGLRPLLAQFMRTPIIPVVNERLNDVFGIYNVCLSSITGYTDKDFPDTLSVELIMHKTTVMPYIQRHDADLDRMICYPLFRWYYQQVLQPTALGRVNQSWLQPIVNYMNGSFKFYIIDSSFLETNDVVSIAAGIAMVEVDIPNDEVIINSMSLTTHNLFSAVHLQMHTDPSHQYMGSLDTNIFIQLETENRDIVKQFVDLQKLTEEYAINYRDKLVSGFVKLENELVQLFGVEYVMIHAIEIDTVENEPGMTRIAIACVSYDPSQKDNEAVDGFLPFHDKTNLVGNVQSVLLNSMADAPTEYLQTMVAEEVVNNLDLYPDLELPSYNQVAQALLDINAQRRQRNLKDLDFNVFVSPALRGKNYSGFRVDPDFYVKYDYLHLGGMVNPAIVNGGTINSSYPAGIGIDPNAPTPVSTTTVTTNTTTSVPGEQRTFEITAYCACQKCCGKSPGSPGYGVTASGVMVKEWHTIAVDRNVIPMGSWVYIPYFKNKPNGGWFKAEDTGGAIKGNRIDVYYKSHQEALNFGRQRLPVIISKEKGATPPSGTAGTTMSVNPTANSSKTKTEFIALVKAQVGKPYVVTTEGPDTFDCSGLVQWTFAQFGVNITRLTYTQWKQCQEITKGDLTVGDLIYTRWGDGPDPVNPDHVGIYLGDNTIVHAKGKAYGVVQISGNSLGADSRYFRYLPMAEVLQTGAVSSSSGIYNSTDSTGLNWKDEKLPDWIYAQTPPVMTKPYGERVQAPDISKPEGIDELARQMCHDWLTYSWDGRFVKAFPTFAMVILDEGMWISGRRTWTNFYTYHSVLNITTVKDRDNPVDLAIISLTNIYGSLNAKLRYKAKGGDTWANNIFPRIDMSILKQRAEVLKNISLKTGARVHLKMGYGSVAECLPTAFNGVIADIDSRENMTIICQGDGIELVDPILEWDENQRTSIFNLTSTPWTMFYMILAHRGLMFHWGNSMVVQEFIKGLKSTIDLAETFADWVSSMIEKGKLEKAPEKLSNAIKSVTMVNPAGETGTDEEHFDIACVNAGIYASYMTVDQVKPEQWQRCIEIYKERTGKSITVEQAKQMFVGGQEKVEAATGEMMPESLDGYIFGDANPYGIEHFGYVYKKEDDISWGGDPERSTDIDSGKKISAYDTMKNIYDRNPAFPNDPDPGVNWLCQLLGFIGYDEDAGKGGIQMYIGGKSPWDIFRTISFAERDKIVAIHHYHFRSTLFYGMPHWPVKYALRLKSGDGTKKEDYEELYKPFSQFWLYNSYYHIIDNGIRASNTDLVTNCAAIYSIEGKPVTSKVVKADKYIKRELQKTEIFDSTTIQDSFIPNAIPAMETILPFLGFATGESRAVEMCRSHLREKFRGMYQGELLILGQVPKQHDQFYLDDAYTKMNGMADIGRVVIHMGFDTGFITSIKPDLQVAIAGSERNKALLGISRRALQFAKYSANGFLFLLASGAFVVGVKNAKLAGTVWTAVRSIKNIRTAISGLGTIAGGLALTAGATAAAIGSMLGGLVVTIFGVLVLNGMCELYDKYTNRYQQEIKIYPLWYKGMPYTAGIDGHQTLIPGLKDPFYYPDPIIKWENTGDNGATSKDGSQPGTGNDDLTDILQRLGFVYDEFTPATTGQLSVPGTGTNSEYKPNDLMDISRARYFRWPTMSRKITEISIGRMDNNGKNSHVKGIDIAGNQDDPVFVACSGIVNKIGNDPSPGGLGQHVIVSHPGGSQTVYGNLGEVKVSHGEKLDCRTLNNSICIIGTIGTSAKKADGCDQEEPHLHFDILGIPADKTIFHYLE